MKYLFIVALLLLIQGLQGQESKHEIDLALDNCLESEHNFTTAAMTECFTIAAKSWDLELNNKYRELQKHLSPAQKERLKASQKQWILYRDKETAFSNQVYLDKDGTASILSIEQTKLELTRQRTLMFITYLADLTGDTE